MKIKKSSDSDGVFIPRIVITGLGVTIVGVGFVIGLQKKQIWNPTWSSTIQTSIMKLFQKNEVLQACILSGATYHLWNGAVLLYRSTVLPCIAECYSTITITNADPHYDAVIAYLSEQISSEGANYSIQALTKSKKKSRKDYIQEWLGTDKDIPSFEYRLNSDEVIFRITYKKKEITMKRFKSSNPLMGAYSDRPFTPESLSLTVWGSDNKVLKELLDEALEEKLKKPQQNELSIFVQSSSSWLVGWELAMTKLPRSKESVILDVDHMETLLEDARWFFQNAKWYIDRGIPYRRGYLLWGPPGCGKTSFVQVLASELKLDICILNLTHSGLDDNNLAELVRDAPSKSIILVEDVDAIFVEREAVELKRGKKGGSASGVSFSGLLNAIDGVAAQEGRIFFMTTNHKEKLDPALTRPGRCDLQLEVKKASKIQLRLMFLRFFPGEEAYATTFENKLPAFEISMAVLQGFFMRFQSAKECVENAATLLDSRTEVLKSALRRKEIYDHLERVGLEMYTPIFERKGILYADQLEKVELKDVISLSVRLQYDHASKPLLLKLLENEETFMDEQYSLAEISTIRESFLHEFPTLYEQLHGEICPTFRKRNSSRIGEPLLSDDFSEVSAEKLDKLSHLLCEKLSKNGKSIISHFNLRKLLEAHPKNPEKCVESASIYAQERKSESYFLKQMTTKEFLKRAGLFSKIHSFSSFVTAAELLEKFSKTDELAKVFCNDYDLSNEEAAVLEDIVKEKENSRGSLLDFGLYDRARIISTFKFSYLIEDALLLTTFELDDVAYEYGVKCTNGKGQALVSIIEVKKHLSHYKSNPREALQSVEKELLYPPEPEIQTPVPKPAPSEWVHFWLKSIDSEMVKYSRNFIEEGFIEKDDLKFGEVFGDKELQDSLGVQSAGHRRKIIHWHRKLLNDDQTPPQVQETCSNAETKESLNTVQSKTDS